MINYFVYMLKDENFKKFELFFYKLKNYPNNF